MSENNVTGKKVIKLGEATLLVIGIVIGSGVFFKPSKVLADVGGAPGLAILAWAVGAVITIAGALSIAEIGSAIPKTGGLMIYLKELYGEKFYFLMGWVQVLVYFPGIAAALSVVFASQCTTLADITPAGQKIVAVLFIVFLTAINLISTKAATKFTVIFTIGKLIPIAAIFIFGIMMGNAHGFVPMISDKSTGAGFGAAILGVLFSFEGWITLTNMGNELEKPSKNLPKAIIFGLSFITLIYLGVNIAIFNTISPLEVMASKKVAADAAVILFGPVGAKLIAVGILVSITGCVSGLLLTASRLPYAMAEDNLIPFKNFFGATSKSGTPVNALIFQAVLGIIYAVSGSFDALTNLAVFVIWLFFLLGIGGVFILRSKHKELIGDGQYKVPLYPVIPIIGILGAVYIVISTLITSTSYAFFGIGVTLLGLPVYAYLKRK